MLTITVPAREFFNEQTGEFFWIKEQKITLEHSLVSISKWEAKWQKPFLDAATTMTQAENLDYVRCMTLTQNVDPMVYMSLTSENYKEISDYIGSSRSATWFNDQQGRRGKRGSEVVTSELIYYWMVAYQIPFECQKWHLNRLLTLIRICDIKNQPQKNMSKNSILRDNQALNKARRAKYHTKG